MELKLGRGTGIVGGIIARIVLFIAIYCVHTTVFC